MTATTRLIELPAMEYHYSPIDEMLTTLQELQNEFKDSQLDVSKILSKVESGLDRAADKLKAGKAAAGLSDAERCDIAAELILSWVAECEFDSVTELPAEWQEELIHEALEAVLLDVAFYSSWRGEAERLKPLLCIALVKADKESVAESQQLRQQRALVNEVKNAQEVAHLDREVLGIGLDVELTPELIEEAKAAAEAKAGLSKRGKTFARFANAARRLNLSIEYVITEGGQDQ